MTHDTPHDDASRPRLGARLWPFGALALVVFALYHPILQHPFVLYDDLRFILANPLIHGPEDIPFLTRLLTLHVGYIIPVTVFSQRALYLLGNGEAWPFHLAGLLLHAVVSGLLFGFIRSLLRARGVPWRAATGFALLAATIFAVHPVTAEPVSWATGLKDLWMATFAIASTWLFFQLLNAPAVRTRALVGVSVLALCAVLSKPTGALVGFAWLAMLASRKLAGEEARPAHLRAAVAVACIGVVIALMSRAVHAEVLEVEHYSPEGGVLPALLALGHQAHHLFWPTELHPWYYIERTAGFGDVHTILGLVAAVVLLAGVVLARRSPSVLTPLALLGAVYAPVSGIVPFYRFVADSYLYVPLAMVCALLAIGLSRVPWERVVLGVRVVGLVVFALAVGWCAQKTWTQEARWSSDAALWTPLARSQPEAWKADPRSRQVEP